MTDLFHQDLVAALAAAGRSHHEYEQNALAGKRDEQWPGYYAAYVLGRLGDFATPTSLAAWLQQIGTESNWLEAAANHVVRQLDS